MTCFSLWLHFLMAIANENWLIAIDQTKILFKNEIFHENFKINITIL